MAGAHPNGDRVRAVTLRGTYLGKPHAGLNLHAFHAQHENFIFQLKRLHLAHQAAQALRVDGDYNHVAVFHSVQIICQM